MHVFLNVASHFVMLSCHSYLAFDENKTGVMDAVSCSVLYVEALTVWLLYYFI